MFSQTDKKNSPIGIFDSGLGGLTVANAVQSLLPNESILYFGDTAHTPWGNKSAATINKYACKITEFLLEQQCKLIVVACNTAASVALEKVIEIASWHDIEVLNVIDPVIEHVANNYENSTISLIGTKQTVKSNTYENKIKSLDKKISLNAIATPMLVPLIEEGWIDNEPMRATLGQYIEDIEDKSKAVILGCTHYPVLSDQLQALLPEKEIINSAMRMAIAVKGYLEENDLFRTELNSLHPHKFYVSDDVQWFGDIARKLFFSASFRLHLKQLFV
jgi:glutamate racemase